MRGFSQRATVDQCVAWIDSHAKLGGSESLELDKLAGRVLAEDVVSAVDVPGFDRAMMDGFAVRAADTSGAAAYNRLTLDVVGSMMPGGRFDGQLRSGQAIRIMTGAPLPRGADAVLPAEKVDVDSQQIHVLDEVPPAKHVGRRGEDIQRSTTVLARGRRLRPQDVGVLSSIGVGRARVVRAPTVRVVVTGNELLPPGSVPRGQKVTDSNSPMLAGLIRRDGGTVINPGIVPDDPEQIAAAMGDDADVVLVSGGSSVGQEDHAPSLLARDGELAIHGVAMRPSSPAGMGRLGDRLVFLLPGNPVSCLCAYDFFASRAIRRIAGLGKEWPYRSVQLPLRRKLVSTVGRVDYARIRIKDDHAEPISIGGASVLTSTTYADGFVVVRSDSEGYASGSQVMVYLYDEGAAVADAEGSVKVTTGKESGSV